MGDYLEYETDNIIIGYGEVPSVQTEAGLAWVLLGGFLTYDRDLAMQHAEELDRLIGGNLKRYKRKLFK